MPALVAKNMAGTSGQSGQEGNHRCVNGQNRLRSAVVVIRGKRGHGSRPPRGRASRTSPTRFSTFSESGQHHSTIAVVDKQFHKFFTSFNQDGWCEWPAESVCGKARQAERSHSSDIAQKPIAEEMTSRKCQSTGATATTAPTQSQGVRRSSTPSDAAIARPLPANINGR